MAASTTPSPSIRTVLIEVLRLLAALAIASALVTLLALAFASLGLQEPERSARKGLVPFYFAAWFLLMRPRKRDLPTLLPFGPWREGIAPLVRGFLVGALSLVLLNLLLLAVGARVIAIDAEVWKIPLYALMALVGATLENGLFRGIIHARFERAGGTTFAVTFGALLYSVTHFLRPTGASPVQGPWDTMPATFRGLGSIVTEGRWRELFGLFLVGLVLSLLRVRTGLLWLPLGVHAGWIFIQHSHRKTLELVPEVIRPAEWWLGTQDNYDGLAGWIALLLALGLAARAPSPPSGVPR